MRLVTHRNAGTGGLFCFFSQHDLEQVFNFLKICQLPNYSGCVTSCEGVGLLQNKKSYRKGLEYSKYIRSNAWKSQKWKTSEADISASYLLQGLNCFLEVMRGTGQVDQKGNQTDF